MSYAIITTRELERMQKSVAPATISSNAAERERLKTLSDARAQQWPNTIEAQRARKERERQERLDFEEMQKQAVDAQEAQLKAEARQLQIERANKMLYDETDKVKAFHSSLMLSDVLAEREAQIAYKKDVAELKKKHEQIFVKEQERALEIAEAAEQKKWEERRKKALQERDAQLDQLEALKKKILAEKAQNMREGELLKKKADAEVQQVIQEEEDRRQRALENNRETIKANEALRQYKELEYLREVEVEKKIAEFAKQKEKTILERKKREVEKDSAKQRERERMIAIMEADLLSRQQDANTRLNKQAEEARIAEDMREAVRAAERKEEQECIDRSRQQQLSIRKAQKSAAAEEEKAFVKQWKVRNEQLKLEEEMEKISQFKRNKQVQDAHLRAMDRKLAKASFERTREMEDALATQLVIAEDEELFKHYTNVCMEEWKSQGKNLTPMMLEITRREKLAK